MTATAEKRPCADVHPDPSITAFAERPCPLCYRFETNPRFRKKWGGNPDEARRPTGALARPAQSADNRVVIPLPCQFEGPITSHSTCNTNPELKHLRQCLHPSPSSDRDLCTRGENNGSVQSCVTCPDRCYQEPTIRHLLYHIYPRQNGRWRRALLRIQESLPLFNGTKTIAVAFDGTTEHPQMVRDAMEGTGCEIIEVRNDPDRREVATFLPLFEKVAGFTGPEHATFYGHAKGVTRPKEATSDRWREALNDIYLDDWPAIARQLTRYPVTGAFKKIGRGWRADESESDWHYSGSWLWFRNDALFRRANWQKIDQFWGGIEPYPSLHFDVAEAGCLFHEGRVPGMNLYNADYWRAVVEPEFSRWKSARSRRSPSCRNLNLGCGQHSFPGWFNVDVIETDIIRPDQIVPFDGSLPFDDGAFERAYLGHVLEHIPWDRVQIALAEVRRVVRKGGEVRIVGPDVKRAIRRSIDNPDKPAAESHLWEVIEDHSHHQRQESIDWPGARHQWCAYADRIVWAMNKAGFVDVQELPLVANEFKDWPVVDFTNSSQCAVAAKVP